MLVSLRTGIGRQKKMQGKNNTNKNAIVVNLNCKYQYELKDTFYFLKNSLFFIVYFSITNFCLYTLFYLHPLSNPLNHYTLNETFSDLPMLCRPFTLFYLLFLTFLAYFIDYTNTVVPIISPLPSSAWQPPLPPAVNPAP